MDSEELLEESVSASCSMARDMAGDMARDMVGGNCSGTNGRGSSDGGRPAQAELLGRAGLFTAAQLLPTAAVGWYSESGGAGIADGPSGGHWSAPAGGRYMGDAALSDGNQPLSNPSTSSTCNAGSSRLGRGQYQVRMSVCEASKQRFGLLKLGLAPRRTVRTAARCCHATPR